ncbi:hypothetical protein GL50803_0029252 [Giardia duodenalis]|uniref:Uncharacterized protein n=1 Tax=Giardia intestinalis (strain ATCC 50803 / WB clone C6) TaxID=184922 RepID=A8BP45_GIAIC|nr:hypothetical protein GL50803_0029252 [Giardia intestinalis]KAE8304637.1 hypothetical protein GL50803_0029252 [Giardia intestinalis]|eukprot:XP_001705858.1 Hypothetical protein GL50803_29252 [Giardia lamblia ATCC 50803]
MCYIRWGSFSCWYNGQEWLIHYHIKFPKLKSMTLRDKLRRGTRWLTRRMRLVRCIVLLLLLIAAVDKSLALKNASQEAYRITSLPTHESSFVVFKPSLTRQYKQKGLLKAWNFGGRQVEVMASRSEPSVYANWPTASSFADWVSSAEHESLKIVCDPSCDVPSQYYLLSPYQSNIGNLAMSIRRADRMSQLLAIFLVIDMLGWLL